MTGFSMDTSTKKQVFYIHGGESFNDHELFLERLRSYTPRDLPSTEQLTKWTKTFSTDLGPAYEVFMPQMPNKQNAQYEEWAIWFERHFQYLNDDVVLIGCSLGAMFLGRYLIEQATPFSIKALILMAGVAAVPDFPLDDCGDFLVYPEKAGILATRAKEVQFWHSVDDFLVPYEHSVILSKAVPGSTLVTFEDKNHFLVPELPELIAHIKQLG